MADHDLTMSPVQLRARQSYKWRRYPDDVIAACVADMDLGTAPQVSAALARTLDNVDFTYPLRDGRKAERAVAAAFARRMRRLYDWNADPDLAVVLPDLVQATCAAVLAFSDPGDGVVVHVPCYAPFREVSAGLGRRLHALPMLPAAGGATFDLAALAPPADARTRLLILCNPHNPTGRVFTRAELEDVLAFAVRHDLVVVADEIHADLVYPGAVHLPFAALGPAAASRTVTLNSATKSFNIAGLRCAVAHFGSAALLQRFHARIPMRLTGAVGSPGIDATVAAWDGGDAWLDAARDHLLAMRDHAVAVLRAALPALRFEAPQATYLLWLDWGAFDLGQPAAAFFLEHARVALGAGEEFDPALPHWARLNFATSQAILDAMLTRMIAALHARTH